ncbi:Hypothetical predicted protein [Mytilus galloprovincialis]|uniref:RING-type domain-containing protein n=1 Tax=Mytilus galloprovincialis TaxID=29158 RepID=A0A8B6E1N2_MYTGA|nr:Hypothetical predicted protein [Mytilus galloprovincialis]
MSDDGIFYYPGGRREYRRLHMRTSSFIGWISKSKLPVARFAEAGFFYGGCKDIVRCFVCYERTSDFSETDDPVKRHIEMSPNCKYICSLTSAGIRCWEDLIRTTPEPDPISSPPLTSRTSSASVSASVSVSMISSMTASISMSSEITCNEASGLLLCKICLVNKLEVTTRPCGHCSMCMDCYNGVMNRSNRCPVCRGRIVGFIRTFIG